MFFRRKKHFIAFFVSALLLLLLFLFKRQSSKPIVAVRATRGILIVEVTDSGLTRFKSVQTLLAPQNGWISAFNVNVGQNVEEGITTVGTLIASRAPLIDARTREVLRQQHQSSLAQLKQSRSQAQRIELLLKATQEELKRTESVLASGAASLQDVDRLRSRILELRSELETARASSDGAQHASEAAAAALSASGPSTPSERQILKSPMTGIISWIYDDRPRFVSIGTPLLDIARPTEMIFEIDLLAPESLLVQEGQNVRFTESDIRARVRRVSPTALTQNSPLGISEQRVRVWVDFNSPVPHSWPAGLELEAHIQVLIKENVIKVPLSATWEENQQSFLFTIEGNRLRKRIVRLGARSNSEVEILHGVDEGESIARLPTEDMQEGERVSTGI
jgi:HlyD family secretion protein